MTNVEILEALRAALAAFRQVEQQQQVFIEENDTDGEPRCGYAYWDEKRADHLERLAERGEHLADAVEDMLREQGK
ncbi:Uncharacterised protein [Mycobacteroides abscessus subsp. abscessus]|uniref:hypothetical protein n=1 Tax=Mycobacteroides abscessus TaxID=36809 RepID=UPI0009A86D85|nr:hypothetical protein [Mycobacteroides abscessus]SKV09250.1 Uncharacterised protein [Mycobacteroides abscessus subsp. abscessus]SKY69746.1 Uncharacterised protein [Mycobacteroides abscessus subsp. abscessus]